MVVGVTVLSHRFIHSDVKFPSFYEERRADTIDPTVSSRSTEDARRSAAPGILYGLGGMFGIIAAKETIQKLVAFKWIPADLQALGSIEVKLSEIPEGEVKVYEWRGKPVFVAHRTAEDIARERDVPLNELRDPERDEDRVKKDEWLVIVGVCTHLGCVPTINAGDYRGGYFCPCHGSHFDGSGRVRKGPAPTNMVVPNYTIDEDKVIFGSSS
uniref:Cytochrome b-c1 complex subunit Rieske, mitochondrial n=1 Tax=Syphacia muris TaxID=451379 RepID=A0A0N5AUS5_9BILA